MLLFLYNFDLLIVLHVWVRKKLTNTDLSRCLWSIITLPSVKKSPIFIIYSKSTVGQLQKSQFLFSCNQLFNIFQLLYVTHKIQIWRLFSKSETVWIENPPLDKALTFKKRLPHKHDSLSSVFINFLIYLIPINLSP